MILRNATKELFTAQLTHDGYCVPSGQCSCMERIPSAIYFAPGEARELHASAANLRDIDRALRRGMLVIVAPEPKTDQRASAGIRRRKR